MPDAVSRAPSPAIRGEALANQGGADDGTILLDQAAIGLCRHDGLRDPGNGQRIGETGERGHGDDEGDCGAKMIDHDYTR